MIANLLTPDDNTQKPVAIDCNEQMNDPYKTPDASQIPDTIKKLTKRLSELDSTSAPEQKVARMQYDIEDMDIQDDNDSSNGEPKAHTSSSKPKKIQSSTEEDSSAKEDVHAEESSAKEQSSGEEDVYAEESSAEDDELDLTPEEVQSSQEKKEYYKKLMTKIPPGRNNYIIDNDICVSVFFLPFYSISNTK